MRQSNRVQTTEFNNDRKINCFDELHKIFSESTPSSARYIQYYKFSIAYFRINLYKANEYCIAFKLNFYPSTVNAEIR